MTNISNSRTIGEIKLFPVDTPPAHTLVCNGGAVSRTAYAELFAVLGTKYGAGDGSTTFNLPDLRGRFVRGAVIDAAVIRAVAGAYNGAKSESVYARNVCALWRKYEQWLRE